MTSIISSGAGGEGWMGRHCWWWGTAALQILTTILLSLFLPLSYLLQARLHDFNGGSGSGSDDDGDGDFFFAFVFVYFNSTILYFLLSFLAFAAFLNALTGGRVTMIQLLFRNTHQRQSDHGGGGGGGCPCLSAAWLLLCTSIIVAELGIEYQSSSPSPSPESRRSSPGGWFFAVGLYETMMYWSESMVQAVVHDVLATATAVVMGFSREEEEEIKERINSIVVERVGLGLSFGALWWWRLRHHVDSLAAAAEENDDDHIVLKVGDFLSLGLYFLTLITGVIRAFTGATGMMHLIIRRWSRRKRVAVRPAPAAAVADVETV